MRKITNMMYVFRNDQNRQVQGIEKEEMIKQLQRDIPRENLYTIFLIDGFGVDKYWCFLTEYYPKNLKQALQKSKPFPLVRVQRLARQLISAVMVLKNNNVVHSGMYLFLTFKIRFFLLTKPENHRYYERKIPSKIQI